MIKKIAEVLAVALVVALVVGVYFRLAGSIPVSVTSTAKEGTFDVTGEGKVAVKPDQAQITLGVRKEAATVAAATEQVDAVMSELSKRVKSLGVEEKDIKTVDYSVYQNYGPEGRGSGYVASSSVQVTIRELTKASQVLDVIGSLGLEQSGGLIFTLSDELKEKTVREAREIAIEEAKKKAEELASLAGMKLGRIVNVQEGASAQPGPYLMRAEAAKDSLGGGTPAQIEPGTSETRVSVTLSYETR